MKLFMGFQAFEVLLDMSTEIKQDLFDSVEHLEPN